MIACWLDWPVKHGLADRQQPTRCQMHWDGTLELIKKNTSLTPCVIVGVQSWKAALESQWLKIWLISDEFLLFREGEFISYTSGSLTSSLSCLLQCKKTNVEEINPKIVAATVDESQDSVQNNHMHQNNNLPLNFFILLLGFYLNHSVFITLPSTVCVTVTKYNTFSLSS